MNLITILQILNIVIIFFVCIICTKLFISLRKTKIMTQKLVDDLKKELNKDDVVEKCLTKK